MISKALGSDVPISVKVTVDNKPALIDSASAKIYKNDKIVTFVNGSVRNGRVSVLVPFDVIKTIGDYVAVFDVYLTDMGKEVQEVPFKITKSPLGKKRQLATSI